MTVTQHLQAHSHIQGIPLFVFDIVCISPSRDTRRRGNEFRLQRDKSDRGGGVEMVFI